MVIFHFNFEELGLFEQFRHLGLMRLEIHNYHLHHTPSFHTFHSLSIYKFQSFSFSLYLNIPLYLISLHKMNALMKLLLKNLFLLSVVRNKHMGFFGNISFTILRVFPPLAMSGAITSKDAEIPLMKE